MGNINIDPSQDFTADPVIGDENKGENSSNVDILHTNEEEEEAVKPSPAPAKKTKPAKKFSAGQNPLMTLNEARPGLCWECSETGHSPVTKKFCMKVVIDGETFEGSGVSKKLAKQAAAKTILTKLYNVSKTYKRIRLLPQGYMQAELYTRTAPTRTMTELQERIAEHKRLQALDSKLEQVEQDVRNNNAAE